MERVTHCRECGKKLSAHNKTGICYHGHNNDRDKDVTPQGALPQPASDTFSPLEPLVPKKPSARANSAQQKLSRRVFTPNRPMIKRQKPVARAYDEQVLFTCYAQLLRWRYSDPIPEQYTPELEALALAIQKWMEDVYESMTTAFRNECKNGNTDVVHEALRALGPHAFYEKWFNEGLKDLLFIARKSIQLIPPEKILDFGEDYENMYQLEEKLQETTVDEATGQDETLRSQYYRDFPKKRDITILRYCFFLGHPTLYTQVIEDLPVLDADTFSKLLDEVKRNLPSK